MPRKGGRALIEIPEKLIEQLVEDRNLYGLKFSQMTRAVQKQGIQISVTALKNRLRSRGLVS
jgi:hypothetical protein